MLPCDPEEIYPHGHYETTRDIRVILRKKERREEKKDDRNSRYGPGSD
jgi:hypothetical protein